MKSMTVGKKIALGFGALILIATLLGGLAVFNMKSVQTQAQKLATEFVPESMIAADLGNAVGTVQLGIRSYGLTAEAAYLEAARKGLEEVHKQQQIAQKLADEHPQPGQTARRSEGTGAGAQGLRRHDCPDRS